MFLGLGSLPAAFVRSKAYGISADGSVVVGETVSSSGMQAFRWTMADGMQGLGDLPGGTPSSAAHGVSADGSVIVGQSTSSLGPEAFRWTSSEGMVGLGSLPGPEFRSSATDVSADGSVVVGSAGGQAFRWDSAGGLVGLAESQVGNVGVSADGSVVVGSSAAWAFRWTAEEGLANLSTYFSFANDVSADGSVVVGEHFGQIGLVPFRWNEGGGEEDLLDLSGRMIGGRARAASEDGNVVVGVVSYGTGGIAMTWDPVTGVRDLRNVLIDEYGLPLAGWKLESAEAISADGRTIVGYGINPNGRTEAWLAFLPEPSASSLLGVGLVAYLCAAATRSRASSMPASNSSVSRS
jgi:probable HAF family extracellular repeat protein